MSGMTREGRERRGSYKLRPANKMWNGVLSIRPDLRSYFLKECGQQKSRSQVIVEVFEGLMGREVAQLTDYLWALYSHVANHGIKVGVTQHVV